MPQQPAIRPEDVLQDVLPVVRNAGGPGICALYRVGHKIHTTQVRLAGEDVGTRGRLARTPTGFVLEPFDGGQMIGVTCHRPADISRLLEICGPEDWRLSHGVLVHGRHGVSVAVGDQELEACRVADAPFGALSAPIGQRVA